MKKLFFLPLLLPLVFMGCKKGAQDAEPETIKLSVEPNTVISPSIGADYTLSLTAPEAWTASCADSWVKVSPTSGNAGTVEINVKISANKESKESNSKIVFKSGDKTLEVPVKRAAKDPAKLRITTDKAIQTPKDGGEYAIKVESNIKWSISSNAVWAKVQGEAIKRDNATINIAVNAASTPEETTALIIVKPFGEGAEAGEDTVVITRGGSDATSMVISQNEVNAPADGGSYSINVTSNAKWRVEASWEADWLKVNNGTGDGNGSFSIQVDPATSGKPVSTVITVEEVRSDSYKPVQLNLLVTREGKAAATLSVDPASIDAPAEGAQVALSIKCNYPWTASLSSTKIFTVSTTKGDGDATIVVTVKPATDLQEATGRIIIKSTYGGEQQTIPVHRAGLPPTLTVSRVKIDAPAEGKEYTINVTSNTDWQLSSGNKKIATVSPETGSGDGSFKITVLPATGYYSSTAIITVTTLDSSVVRQIMVTRAGLGKSKYVASPISIGTTKKVLFSPGNLQYRASTNRWRFAEQQYHYVGNQTMGNVYINTDKSDNSKIASNYDGWIDLFGWGTGYNPTLHTEVGNDYAAYTDWGKNQIIYYDETFPTDTWRAPTKDDWVYILTGRPNADKLHGNASINGIYGLVILPDNWQTSSSLPFTGGTTNYQTNSITFAKWQEMEALGAVFLPMAGWRVGVNVTVMGGNYWSSTLMSPSSAYGYYLVFSQERIGPQDGGFRYDGNSVRLVQDVE